PGQLLERRDVTRPTPPLQRDHIEPLALEPSHHLTAPLFGGARRSLRFGDKRLRTQHGMAITKERVAVGHALVRASGETKDCLTSPDVREREGQAVDRDPVADLDESLGFIRVAVGIGPPGEPPAVLAALGWPQRRVRKDVIRAHLLSTSESLEDRTPGKL